MSDNEVTAVVLETFRLAQSFRTLREGLAAAISYAVERLPGALEPVAGVIDFSWLKSWGDDGSDGRLRRMAWALGVLLSKVLDVAKVESDERVPAAQADYAKFLVDITGLPPPLGETDSDVSRLQ